MGGPALHVTNGDAAVPDVARAAGDAAEAVVPWRDARLAAPPADGEVVLWFEEDLYDALQLAQIGDRLPGRPGPVTRVVMPHDRSGGLDAAFAQRQPFTPDGRAFAALRSPDPRGWAEHPFMERLRPAHDHWVGGVHLVPAEPGWAWDPRARAAVPP